MTILRAMQITNQLLKLDPRTPQPLTDSQRTALAKLVSVATERLFGKNRGSK
jgi:hypothetical protein